MSTTALSRFIATVGYVGYLRPAPGTWGSAAGCILAVPSSFWWLICARFGHDAIVLVIGHWATKEVMTQDGPHDPSEIVVDEVRASGSRSCRWLWIRVLELGHRFRHRRPLDGFWLSLGDWLLFFRLFDI